MAQKTKIETAPPPLDDKDYEFLFIQLLEGVFHGWHQGRVAKFFQLLGDRGLDELWVDWMRRYEEKFIAATKSDRYMAVQMMRLGDLIHLQNDPRINKIGIVAQEIGQKCLDLDRQSSVWEYEGPDTGSNPPESIATEQTVTLEQLFAMLQQDSNLVEQMAQQLGLETKDPQAIIDFLERQIPQNPPSETPAANESPTENAPENTPENAEEWFDLGLQRAEKGNMREAIACWDNALALDPNLSSAWHNRGSALGFLGRFNEAVASFDRAIAINPQDFQAWNDRGLALFNLQNWDEAISSWDRVIEIEPSCFQAWYNRGCLLENTGKVDEALASYQKVLELQPEFEPAQTRLSSLKNNINPNNGQE
jgi:tetratricopeptide (TPR) repeat protein